MQTSNQFHPFLFAATEKFKLAMIYLNAHPALYFLFLAAVLLTVVLVVFSAPKAKNSIVTPALAPQKITKMASSKDISAIAGDDLVSTQLDLAKAYMEMGQTNLAKRILNETLKVGDPAQKSAARQLIETL